MHYPICRKIQAKHCSCLGCRGSNRPGRPNAATHSPSNEPSAYAPTYPPTNATSPHATSNTATHTTPNTPTHAPSHSVAHTPTHAVTHTVSLGRTLPPAVRRTVGVRPSLHVHSPQHQNRLSYHCLSYHRPSQNRPSHLSSMEQSEVLPNDPEGLRLQGVPQRRFPLLAYRGQTKVSRDGGEPDRASEAMGPILS